MGESPINTIQAKLQTIFKQYPNQVAIEYGTETMSYQELDHKSNQVAAAIIQNGGAKGSFIGVLTSDKIDLLLALLGILKAGCVFVPIDPLYP
ncbi:MAG TPA: AMP-binding protein, partial [Bacillota bacterium]|nr:AMP-binding protein [Bacillota bacterium]